MFSKELIEEAQREFSKLSGKEITEGTAEIWLQNLVDYFKILIEIDRDIKSEEADKQVNDETLRVD